MLHHDIHDMHQRERVRERNRKMLNEPGALVRHSTYLQLLVVSGKPLHTPPTILRQRSPHH